MSVSSECRDNLVARARTGPLAPAEQQQLDAHLAQCPLCRTLLSFERGFDGVLGSQTGDEVRAARIVDAAMSMTEVASVAHLSPVHRRSLTKYLLAAALFMVAASAVAAWSIMKSRATMVRAHVSQRVATPPVRSTPTAVEPSVLPTAMQNVQTTEPPANNPLAIATSPHNSEPASAPHESHRFHTTHAASNPQPTDTPVTAASLFASATASRPTDVTRARQLYEQLQQQFPRSTQAVVSRVSLGRLLFEGFHDATGALAQYDAYLSQHLHTVLMAEALFGRASALMRLGRRVDERTTWQQLLDRFPESVYASRAHARLEQLR